MQPSHHSMCGGRWAASEKTQDVTCNHQHMNPSWHLPNPGGNTTSLRWSNGQGGDDGEGLVLV